VLLSVATIKNKNLKEKQNEKQRQNYKQATFRVIEATQC
jgi:hypothetical protein